MGQNPLKKNKKPSQLVFMQSSFQSSPMQNWKNGQGKTRELGKSSEEPYAWRLSSAFIEQDCEFSLFPKYERIICILEGGAVKLSHSNGTGKTIELLSPYKFSGDGLTRAKVSTPSADLNLFILKNKAKGNIFPMSLRAYEEYQLPITGDEHFVICVDGEIELVERQESKTFQLKQGEFIRITKIGKKEFPNLKVLSKNVPSTVVWIPIHYLDE